MSESRKNRTVGRVGKGYSDELEVTVPGRCTVWRASLCSAGERKAALLGRHCCLETGSFSDWRRGLIRRHRRRRRYDRMLEAC